MRWTAMRIGNTVFLYYNVDVTGTSAANAVSAADMPSWMSPARQTINWCYFADGTQSLYFTLIGTDGRVQCARRQITAAGGFVSGNMLGTESLGGGVIYRAATELPRAARIESVPFNQIQTYSNIRAATSGAAANVRYQVTRIGDFAFLSFVASVSGTTASTSTFTNVVPSDLEPMRNRLGFMNASGSAQSYYFGNLTTTPNLVLYRRQMTAAGGWVATNFAGNETFNGSLLYLVK